MNSFIKNSMLIFSFLFLYAGLSAQERYFDERYIYTQSYINPFLVNAGATGFDGYQQLFFNYRNNWSTFEGAPKTITLGYNGPVADRLGMGAMFMQDTYGGLATSKGLLSFSYTIESPTNKVGFGLAGEYIQHKANSSLLIGADADDELLLQRLNGTEFFDASFGIYGLYQKKISYGIAFPSLVSSRLDDSPTSADRELGFIFNLGYKISSKTTGITFEPSIMVKKLNAVPTHVDVNGKFGFLDDKFTGGVSYTLGADKRLGFLLGTNVDALNLYYSYNVTSQDFQSYNNGSHELMLVLNIGNKEEKVFILDPK
jgi:type IX secretion system PorP/SprF family membrane protein